MAGLAGRMSTVIKAKISKALDRAEDPSETLDYGYNKQVELLQNVKKGIADVTTSKKRLQMQSGKLEQQVVKLDTQARQALAQGRDDLARAALERKTVAQTELQSLDQQVQELQNQQEALTENEKKLRVKIESFRTKKEVIKAQYSAAEAQVKISEAANGVGEEMADLGLAIQRAEDKTEQMRARASAVEELEAAGTFDDLSAARRRPGRHRPRAGADRRRRPGGRRAGEDEGRAGLGRRRRARAGAGRGEARLMIVRISGEGQFKLPDEDAARLNELDNRAVSAVEQGDETGFRELWSQMLEIVASDGNQIDDDELVESDVILPPRDVTFREAQGEFTGDGLIPDRPLARVKGRTFPPAGRGAAACSESGHDGAIHKSPPRRRSCCPPPWRSWPTRSGFATARPATTARAWSSWPPGSAGGSG